MAIPLQNIPRGSEAVVLQNPRGEVVAQWATSMTSQIAYPREGNRVSGYVETNSEDDSSFVPAGEPIRSEQPAQIPKHTSLPTLFFVSLTVVLVGGIGFLIWKFLAPEKDVRDDEGIHGYELEDIINTD